MGPTDFPDGCLCVGAGDYPDSCLGVGTGGVFFSLGTGLAQVMGNGS